jgi:hypothetical protein
VSLFLFVTEWTIHHLIFFLKHYMYGYKKCVKTKLSGNYLKGGTIMAFIRKRRIWWESVPEAASYVVYVSQDRTKFDPDHFSWEMTPGVLSKPITGKTELIIPDEWPEFPKEQGTYYIGITSRDEAGNQSDPFLSSGLFKFLSPPPPPRGGIETL